MVRKTETYIINLNYNDYPKLKQIADSSDLCKMLLQTYPIQIRAILDETTKSDEMVSYYFYVGLAMAHNLYELSYGNYLSSKEMLESIEEGNLKIEDSIIEQIASDITKMEHTILKKRFPHVDKN